MNNFFSYLKNVRAEFAHITWPKRHTVIGHTLLIIVISAVVAVFIALLDYFFTGIVGSIVS